MKNLKRFSVLKNFKNILSGGLRKGAHGCKYGRLQELTEHLNKKAAAPLMVIVQNNHKGTATHD